MRTIASTTSRVIKTSNETMVRRYQRIAWMYDFLYTQLEKGLQPARSLLWQLVDGPKVLEVGVGTGRNYEVDHCASKSIAWELMNHTFSE